MAAWCPLRRTRGCSPRLLWWHTFDVLGAHVRDSVVIRHTRQHGAVGKLHLVVRADQNHVRVIQILGGGEACDGRCETFVLMSTDGHALEHSPVGWRKLRGGGAIDLIPARYVCVRRMLPRQRHAISSNEEDFELARQ